MIRALVLACVLGLAIGVATLLTVDVGGSGSRMEAVKVLKRP